MEYEIRFYYPKNELENIKALVECNTKLNKNSRKYEKTTQYNHPSKEFDFYSKAIDGRFRVRMTNDEMSSSCKLSWKRRLNNTHEGKINNEEEVELTILPEEYSNLEFIIKNVLQMNIVECYERYRTTFTNEEVEIAIDEYPFGIALEIEVNKKYNNCAENIIGKYVKELNLDYNRRYKLSWDDKYEELCNEQGIVKYSEVLFNKKMPEVK